MKVIPTAFLGLLFSVGSLGYRGVNIGGCLTQEEWLGQFNIIKSWGFDSVRLFSSASCDTIMRAAPAAIQANITLLAGIWAVPDANYASEKAAFLNAVQTFGTSYLAGVSVGSESLYRKEIDPNILASRVTDVKSTLPFQFEIDFSDSLGPANVSVGCTDTWTSWVDPVNNAVISSIPCVQLTDGLASDMIIMNGFPYWQGSAIEGANTTFYQSYTATQNAIDAISSGKPIWVGETGWPTGYPQLAVIDCRGRRKWISCALDAEFAELLVGDGLLALE